MAIALLLATGLAVAGLAATSIQGFALSSALPAASPLAKALVGKHVTFAIPTVLFSLFSQSMVIFYFIGTGKLVKEEAARLPEKERQRILEALRRLKLKTSPPATFSLASAIAVFVLGGAVHTQALPSWTHLAASILALALHGWALVAEWAAFSENARLMADPRAYARRASGSRLSSGGPPSP